MHRAMANAVSGRKIMAEGKWLTCIGNIKVKAGDYIWTDGKCVYGHQSEAGGNTYIITVKKDDYGIIPLLLYGEYAYYDKGKIEKIGRNNLYYYGGLVNRNDRFYIWDWRRFDFPDTLLDAEFDDDGNLYTLFSDYYLSDDYSNGLDAAAGISGGFRIEKNGVVIDRYNASSFLAGLGRTRGIDFEAHYAKVNTDGSFKIIIGYYFDGGSDERDITRRLFFDGTKTEMWTNNSQHAPAHSIRFPIQDGWFSTFVGAPDDDSFLPDIGGNYTVNCYNEKGEFVFSSLQRLPIITSVCDVGDGKYLFVKYSDPFNSLFLWDNGRETFLQSDCFNLRLRKADIKKWKQELGL